MAIVERYNGLCLFVINDYLNLGHLKIFAVSTMFALTTDLLEHQMSEKGHLHFLPCLVLVLILILGAGY